MSELARRRAHWVNVLLFELELTPAKLGAKVWPQLAPKTAGHRITDWKTGNRRPVDSTVEELAAACGVDPGLFSEPTVTVAGKLRTAVPSRWRLVTDRPASR